MALAATQQRAAFLGSSVAPRVAARPVLSRQAVKPQALFGFGKKDASAEAGAAPQYYICVDCGYIYPDGDFKKAPGSYRCPVCNSPKGRFKMYKGAVKGKPNNSGSAMKQRFSARQW